MRHYNFSTLCIFPAIFRSLSHLDWTVHDRNTPPPLPAVGLTHCKVGRSTPVTGCNPQWDRVEGSHHQHRGQCCSGSSHATPNRTATHSPTEPHRVAQREQAKFVGGSRIVHRSWDDLHMP